MTPGLLLKEDFSDDRAAGNVIGSRCEGGQQRLGADVEHILSIDNGALRVPPLIAAGFGRAALAYGPFDQKPGLALAVYMLNGHNTAQGEPLSDAFRYRVRRWFEGSEPDHRFQRLVWWLARGRFRRFPRQLRWWWQTSHTPRANQLLDENLAIGWFPTQVPADPRIEGATFLMHALGPENGELWTGQRRSRTRALRGVQNVPIYYVAVVRNGGVVYYVSSIPGARDLPSYPWLRPVGIEHTSLADTLYGGLQQGVIGQVGFRLDSRVYGVRVAQLSGFDSWHGGAHAAERLVTPGELSGSIAELGGSWSVSTVQPVTDVDPNRHHLEQVAVLNPGARSGLVHGTVLDDVNTRASAGLVWRYLDECNHWRLELRANSCEMVAVEAGSRRVVATCDRPHTSGNPTRLQILDDGERQMGFVDGEPLSHQWIVDEYLQAATLVGVWFGGVGTIGTRIERFEAHPLLVSLPNELDMGAPWFRKGERVLIEDHFAGAAGDLEGRITSTGGARWHRVIGQGVIETTGAGSARVRASVGAPAPGRTAYCIDSPNPDFVDLEVMVTPPASTDGDGHRTTAGFVLYQDAENYVTQNAYRSGYYPGGSVSTFFKFGGYEDVYDAIWSNVGDRVRFGQPLRLRLCCDGERYVVLINDETVLFRSFRDVYPDIGRLRIRKVGIIANWEFGADTGSTFEHFKLRV